MNKYQEALDKLAYILEIYSIDIDDKDIKKVKDCLNILGELVDKTKTPTLEELIKEWEDDDFKFEKIFCYQLINRKDGIEIYFDMRTTGIECSFEGCVSSKQLIRLIRTFLALGWEV